MFKELFPYLSEVRFGEVNLDVEAQDWLARSGLENASENPLLRPATCSEFVAQVHQAHGIDCSYGGYLEDRSSLLHGTYLSSTGNFLHLGVDFSVPAETDVACPLAGEVLIVDNDRDRSGGWGPRVVVAPHGLGIVVIFAHLLGVKVRVGQALKAGAKIGKVGNPPRNGNWWPHLHVQCVLVDHFRSLLEQGLSGLDGYGNPQDHDELERLYPDPLLAVLKTGEAAQSPKIVLPLANIKFS